jgi:hypothetical protein
MVRGLKSDIGKLLGVFVLLLLLVGVAGCGGGSSDAASSTQPGESTSSSPTPSTSPVCPNPEGDACLGVLKAGTYKTARFEPPITYTVPGGGWANQEDSPVSFFLVPPGVPFSQVHNATNVIIVWPGVEVAAMDCSGSPGSGVDDTPKAIAAWLNHHAGLTVAAPRPITMSGLKGYVVSLHLAKRGGVRCGAPLRSVPLLNNLGNPQAQFGIAGTTDHALIYLLDVQGTTLGIIADSSSPHRASLAADANVIRHFRFTIG